VKKTEFPYFAKLEEEHSKTELSVSIELSVVALVPANTVQK
jgi:hypothetical protein